MKNEAEFCTVVNHSLICGHKIADPGAAFSSTIKRCFDGIGMLEINNELKFVCWEAKFLKKPQAFNFANKIESHQSYYLSEYSKSDVLCYVLLCVDYGRSDKRVFIFEWNKDMDNLYREGYSIHKKVLDSLPYNKVSKSKFDFENIIKFEDLTKKAE